MTEGTLAMAVLLVVLIVVVVALIIGFGPVLSHVLDRLPHAP